MRLGILGLPNSGKTTIFNSLTGFEAEVSYHHRQTINKGYVEILDERVELLQIEYDSSKLTYSGIEVFDFAKSEDDRDNEYFNSVEARLLDIIAIVVRCFNDDIISGVYGLPDPKRDLQTIQNDFIISDLIIAEKRLEKVKLNLKRGVRSGMALVEEKLLERIVSSLQNEVPVRELELTPEEEKLVRSFQFLTNKTLMILINSDEISLDKAKAFSIELNQLGHYSMIVAGKFEMELIKLDKDDAELFLNDLGFNQVAKERVIELAVKTLNFIHFFTANEQEARAWMIAKGLTAQEAASKVHTDMGEGFIKAECFNVSELKEWGNVKVLKEKGKVRLEGKSYIVEDGDVLIIRFSN